MEINPVVAYIPLSVYHTKYGIKKGDTIIISIDSKHTETVVDVLSDSELLCLNYSKKHTITSIVNTIYVAVEVVRVCDINFKHTIQKEINFSDGKSV